MRTSLFAGSLVALLLSPLPALACDASPGGARSFDLRVSPRAGILCLYTVTEYEGATCDAGHVVAHDDLGCSMTSRLALTDDGVFVSIAGPRMTHRDWTLVYVFSLGDQVRHAELTLDDLPEAAPLGGVVRASFDAGALLLRDREHEVRIALATLASRAE